MTIKKPDGSIFRLNGPNPITKQQDFWNECKLHNFKYSDFVTKEGYTDIQEIAVEEIEIPQKEEQILKSIDKVMLHCLPADINEHYDALYGETRTSISYGQQFTFESVIVERADLTFKIWTNAKITRGSILFAPKDRDWWKVDNVESQSNGIVVRCIPSETQPSFG